MRIVSLLPSATEIVCALGAQGQLVGISHECDYPDVIRHRPVLTRSRIDAHGTSKAIDEAVRVVIRDALSIYAVDDAKLRELAPDVIVTQDLCEVCAVSLDDVRAAVARVANKRDIRIVSLSPTRLDDVLDDVLRVGEALGRASVARDVRASLASRLAAIRTRADACIVQPRVASVEWLEPIMLGGTWMPELIATAGGIAAGAHAGAPAPTVTAEQLVALEPDVVLVKPCGFSLDRALQERDVIDRNIVLPLRAAGSRARIYVTDGNAFFNRPGPRLVESAEILAAVTHPAAFADFVEKHACYIRAHVL